MDLQTSSSLPEHMTGAQRQKLAWAYTGLRIEMVSARWWRVDSTWRMHPRKLHDDFLFLPMSHRLVARIEGVRAEVLPGQCMFVRAGQEHEARMPEGCPEMHIVSLHAHFWPEWGGTLEQLAAPGFHDLPDSLASEGRLKRLIHVLGADPALGGQMGREMLRDWMASWALKQVGNAPMQASVDTRVLEALALIHAHFEQPLTVGKMARHVRLGTVQFTKLFRQFRGQSPKAYLAEHRLAQAAQQIRLGTTSVKEVAHATGFTDVHYFHLAFKRRFGCTPLAYRKQGSSSV
jgi:AraC-like DNA-binding protein